MDKIRLIIIFPLAFFVIGLLTLPHYGINWDTINHLPRGQAYLNYFLSGSKDYSNLKVYKNYWQKPESLRIDSNIPISNATQRSYYQSDSAPFWWFLDSDGNGHPPLSDILSSFFNLILFQKLALVNDIDSYRVYGIFLASLLIGLVFWWTRKAYGTFAAVSASLSLSLYPLFWSEAHFNTEKDIPEAFYFSIFLFTLWKAFTTKRWRWNILSGIFFGLALGTKFNILFASLIIIPWLVFYFYNRFARTPDFSPGGEGETEVKASAVNMLQSGLSLKQKKTADSQSAEAYREHLENRYSWIKVLSINKRIFLSLLLIPLIGGAIFFIFWPYLWSDPIDRLKTVFGFYKTIGIESNPDPNFTSFKGVNTYPMFWIITTTPLVILFFAFIGMIKILKGRFKDKTSLLFLLWLFIPIARVTWPGATIYGGVRQIMEYIPALAIIAGIGASGFRDLLLSITKKTKIKNLKIVISLLILLSFLPILIKLIQIHPNENVYFNPLIGGLKGARDKNVPAWGNSFGAAYRQGVVWINQNAEKNSKIVFARELNPNFPSIWLRSDLEIHNSYRSGSLRLGEYVIALTYHNTFNTSYFERYLERFLIPVYSAKVDEVPIMKVWKNDLVHTNKNYIKEEPLTDYEVSHIRKSLRFEFDKKYYLSKIEIDFPDDNCSKLVSGSVRISEDGRNWLELPGHLPKEDWSVPKFGDQPTASRLMIPFAADFAKFVELEFAPQDACIKSFSQIKVSHLPDVGN